MINVNELEAKWFKYKIRSFIPHIVILLSITVITTVFILFNTKPITNSTLEVIANKKNQLETQQVIPLVKPEQKVTLKPKEELVKTQPIILIKETIKSSSVVPMKVEPIYHDNPPKNILSPSLDFMAKLQGDSLPYFDTGSQDRVTELAAKIPSIKTKIKKVQKKVTSNPIQPIVKKNSIQIDRQNTHDDINQVIKRFKKNNNPALSLFIAKKYYQLEEYHQSYNYSLMTNEIDNDIEASWIIFSKSLVKLNEKSMAIETLNKYISHSNSHRAKILLDDITSGKFK